MQQTGISGRPRWAVALTGLGGLLMVIGAILPVLEGSTGGPFEGQSIPLLDTPDGKLYLGVGIGLVVLAIFQLAMQSTAVKKYLPFLTILAAGFMLYAAIVDTLTTGDRRDVLGGVAEVGIGLYVVLAGSIIALVGGVLSLIATRSTLEAPPPPEPPSEPASS